MVTSEAQFTLEQAVTEAPGPVPVEAPASAWRVWHSPDMRRLGAGDIVVALACFQSLTGEAAKIVCLSPKNEHLTNHVPQGIECRVLGGCSRAEIWLAAGEPEAVKRGQFDAENDQAVIREGGFYCHGCLVGKPAAERSPDPRYCQGCYSNLLRELEVLKDMGRTPGDWQPSPSAVLMASGGLARAKAAIAGGHTLSEEGEGILSQENKRGRPPKPLPGGTIRDMAAQGKSSRAIAQELERQGYATSYKSVQRVLRESRAIVGIS